LIEEHYRLEPTGFGLVLDAGLPPSALELYFYNFCRVHKTLKITPAMAAGVTEKLWNMEDIVALIDARDERKAKRIAGRGGFGLFE
jgi:hypothetical protein